MATVYLNVKISTSPPSLYNIQMLPNSTDYTFKIFNNKGLVYSLTGSANQIDTSTTISLDSTTPYYATLVKTGMTSSLNSSFGAAMFYSYQFNGSWRVYYIVMGKGIVSNYINSNSHFSMKDTEPFTFYTPNLVNATANQSIENSSLLSGLVITGDTQPDKILTLNYTNTDTPVITNT